MTTIRVTTTVEIIENGRTVGAYSRTVEPLASGNPRFYGRYADEGARISTADVRSAVEAVHGQEPTPVSDDDAPTRTRRVIVSGGQPGMTTADIHEVDVPDS